ncbi:MAG: hypothetical protein JWM44_4362 [Bacilli bacterium]|jgi:proteasome lid subunit RPN8/RPN11|nr:hypothetical protein [Bacilli bacterium]
MIKISVELIQQIITYCNEKLPNEACGVLFGVVKPDQILINSIRGISNASENPEHQFLFAPHELVTLLYPSEISENWVGIFHSHPATSAFPSKLDLQAHWNLPTYWIVSFERVNQPDLKAYKIDLATEKKPISITEQAIVLF